MGLEDLRGLLATKIPLLTELGDALRLTELRSVANLRCCQAMRLRLQTSSIVNDSSKREFHIEARLRAIHFARNILKGVAICCVTLTILNIVSPISLRGNFVILLIGVGMAVLPCYGRIAGGRGIIFHTSNIEILRGQSKPRCITRNSIQKVEITRRSVSFKYRLDGHSSFKFIGREGFSETSWQEFSDYVRLHVKPVKVIEPTKAVKNFKF